MYYLTFFLSLIEDEDSAEYFRYLFVKYHQKMYYAAYRIAHDDMKAEDAVQETFYRLAATDNQIEWMKSFKYTEKEAYTVIYLCKRTTINMMKKAAERHEELLGFSEEDIKSYARNENFISNDNLESDDEDDNTDCLKIAQAMNELSVEYSNLLMMFYYYKLPIERIMEMLNCDKKTIYVKKSRAIKKLRELYNQADKNGKFKDPGVDT